YTTLSVVRSHWKKFILLFLIMVLIFATTLRVDVHYNTWRSRVDLELFDLQLISANPSTLSKPFTTKYGMYMYLGCTASPLASIFWHVSQAVKVCDLSSADRMCDVKLKSDYNYDQLGLKAGEWLQSDEFSQMLNQNDVVIKLDDDTFVLKDDLDSMVDTFVKSDCLLAGAIRKNQEGLYWSGGGLMLMKADVLKQKLGENAHILQGYRAYDDVQVSAVFDIRDPKYVCNIDINSFKHRYYTDSRMTISFTPYIKC
ncbi:hypothetical protein BGW38_002161, partial [Lunasporangiospora selenospora]